VGMSRKGRVGRPATANAPDARHRRRRRRNHRGVALVEFALVAPLLFLLIFGIVEFGWAFYQLLDVRHGARETARLAAVNYRTTSGSTDDVQRDEILVAGCERMDTGDDVIIVMEKTGTGVNSTITVTVSKPLDQLTGFLDPFLGDIDLSSEVDTRIEQTATWSDQDPPGWDCAP
jgi:Flp pilus assembly protein TadG